jgi:hypothetical protein
MMSSSKKVINLMSSSSSCSADDPSSSSSGSSDLNTPLQTIFKVEMPFSNSLYKNVVLCGKRSDPFKVSEHYAELMRAMFPAGNIPHFVMSAAPLPGEATSPPHIAHQTMLYFVAALAALDAEQFRAVGDSFKWFFTRPFVGSNYPSRIALPHLLRREHVVDICKLVTGHVFWSDEKRYSDNSDIMQAVLCFLQTCSLCR